MAFERIVINLLIVCFLLEPVVTEKCSSNYTVFLKKGPVNPYKTKCPIPPNYFQSSGPLEKRKGVLLEDGACIGQGYKKGVARRPKGIIENDSITIRDIVKGGWECSDPIRVGTECMLPFTSVYTIINEYMIREINDQKRTVTLDLSLTMLWMDYRIKTYQPDGKMQQNLDEIGLQLDRIKDIWSLNLFQFAVPRTS